MTAAKVVESRVNDQLLGLGSCSHYYPPPLAIYRWRNRILPPPTTTTLNYGSSWASWQDRAVAAGC